VTDEGPGEAHATVVDADHHRALWRRIAFVVGAVLALAFVASADVLYEALRGLTDAAAPLVRAHPVAGALAFIAVSALSAMLAFFSGTVLVPVAVEAWGVGATITYLWIGWIIGGITAYTLARVAGRPLVASVLSADALVRYEATVSRTAPFSLVLLLQLGLPSEIPGYLVGLARYPLWKYLVALSIAELPWAVGTVLMGTTLLERRVPVLVAVGLAAAALSGTTFWQLHRRLQRTRAA
jgi:uncharacterized membrane protein YdjX (TVP38/TMEM64 family)